MSRKELISGLNKIMYQLDAKVKPRSVALEAKIEKTFIVAMTFPVVLLYTGRKVTQTQKNTCMLHKMNLALLNTSDRFLVKKAMV